MADEYFISELINYLKKGKISGIFAANDWMAIGLMTRLTALGVRIPEDVSVVGCDDIPLCLEFTPSLSTFKEDFRLIIATVYQSINEMFFSDEYAPKQIVLPATFIKRDSLREI